MGINELMELNVKKNMILIGELSKKTGITTSAINFYTKKGLLNPPKKLRIGMTADIEFDTGESSQRTIVPTVAIVTEKGRPGLLIVDKNKEPFFQEVQLGTSSGNKTAIVSGISPGEKIFIDIHSNLHLTLLHYRFHL